MNINSFNLKSTQLFKIKIKDSKKFIKIIGNS